MIPDQPTGTVSSFTINITVYGSAELTYVSYYLLSFDPTTLNIVSRKQELNGRSAMGCFYTRDGCGGGSALSNSNFQTAPTGVQSYSPQNFFIGITRMIMTWANGGSTSGKFNILNINQNSDTTISVTFAFTGNGND
jgi:hypothetical protein